MSADCVQYSAQDLDGLSIDVKGNNGVMYLVNSGMNIYLSSTVSETYQNITTRRKFILNIFIFLFLLRI